MGTGQHDSGPSVESGGSGARREKRQQDGDGRAGGEGGGQVNGHVPRKKGSADGGQKGGGKREKGGVPKGASGDGGKGAGPGSKIKTKEGAQRHQCSICKACFAHRGHLSQHMRTHTKERPFACTHPGCSLTYTRRDHLTRHNLRAHQGASIACPVSDCTSTLSNKYTLAAHLEWHAKVPPLAEVGSGRRRGGGKGGSGIDEGVGAMNGVVGGSAASGPAVGELDGAPAAKRKKKAALPSSLFVCGVPSCGSQLASDHELADHARTHHSAVKCEVCGKALKNRGCLRKHMQRFHERGAEEERPKWACTVPGCERTFVEQSSLAVHVAASHLNQRKFTCAHCGKSFAYKHVRNRHQITMHQLKQPELDDKRRASVHESILQDTKRRVSEMLGAGQP